MALIPLFTTAHDLAHGLCIVTAHGLGTYIYRDTWLETWS